MYSFFQLNSAIFFSHKSEYYRIFHFYCSHIDTNFVNLFLSDPFLIFLVCRFILVIVSLILTVLSTVQTEEKNFQDILHVPVLVVVSSWKSMSACFIFLTDVLGSYTNLPFTKCVSVIESKIKGVFNIRFLGFKEMKEMESPKIDFSGFSKFKLLDFNKEMFLDSRIQIWIPPSPP